MIARKLTNAALPRMCSSTSILMPTTALQFDLVAQLNSQTKRTLGLSRIRWRWAPGSDLFLVYRAELNQGNGMMSSQSQWDLDEHRLMFKLVWRNDVLF